VERDLGFEVARVLVHPFLSRHQGIILKLILKLI